jgi:cytochrome c oxidase cbb3-type subunit 1
MTQAPSNAIGETDTSARLQLGLLLVSALGWLLVSGLLALIGTLQLHSPGFLSSCSWLTYGHTQALQETALVYGWAGNASFAVAIWILGRLSGAPLRGLGLLTAGAYFWNIGITFGMVCIMMGEATAVPFLQMPAYVHPLLLVAYAAIATPGILAWTGRRQSATFASQWYAVAALFLFPWLYSAAQVMLLAAPVRGVAQAVITAWFAQNLLSLWLLPIALAAAYYLVPKLTGRTISNYDFAPHGFWALLFFGSWTGVRHLVGGPVPAWIPTMGIVTTVILLFHYLIVVLNLRGGLAGKKDPILSFVAFGLVTYLLGGLVDSVFSFKGLAEITQFTLFPVAQFKLSVLAAFSSLILGAIYYLAPRITGVAWPSPGLIRAHFILNVLGSIILVLGFAEAGWAQGHALLDPKASFGAVATGMHPGLLAAATGQVLLLVGSLVLTVHFIRLQVLAGCPSFGGASNAMEASAS